MGRCSPGSSLPQSQVAPLSQIPQAGEDTEPRLTHSPCVTFIPTHTQPPSPQDSATHALAHRQPRPGPPRLLGGPGGDQPQIQVSSPTATVSSLATTLGCEKAPAPFKKVPTFLSPKEVFQARNAEGVRSCREQGSP